MFSVLFLVSFVSLCSIHTTTVLYCIVNLNCACMADSHMMCAIQLYVPNTNKAALQSSSHWPAGQAHVEDEHEKAVDLSCLSSGRWVICGSPCLDSVTIENEIVA